MLILKANHDEDGPKDSTLIKNLGEVLKGTGITGTDDESNAEIILPNKPEGVILKQPGIFGEANKHVAKKHPLRT